MTTVEEPVVVPVSPLEAQLKGQLRLLIAAVAGALVIRHALPAWLMTDQSIDLILGSVMLAGTSAWSWIRARFNWSRLFTVADDHRVPDAVAKVER